MFNIEFILVMYMEGSFSISSTKGGTSTFSIDQSMEDIIKFLDKKEKERNFLARRFKKMEVFFSSKNISLKKIEFFEEQLKLLNKNIKLKI